MLDNLLCLILCIGVLQHHYRFWVIHFCNLFFLSLMLLLFANNFSEKANKINGVFFCFCLNNDLNFNFQCRSNYLCYFDIFSVFFLSDICDKYYIYENIKKTPINTILGILSEEDCNNYKC